MGCGLDAGEGGAALWLVYVRLYPGSQRHLSGRRRAVLSGWAWGSRYGDAPGCREQRGQDKKEGTAGDHPPTVAYGAPTLLAPRVITTGPSDLPTTSR
ncbi:MULTISPECIES: hypothetical protein [unclassified Streptomyces]|uniref:hypothetical protein n=1 Tax=unclassified Streptomyces TaxID=2593676 RepID=UPI002E1F0F29|nr:hypothetical protein OG217_37515 [Streptomyces sp. NBC_01023]